jgi:hypothetical protein
MKVNGPNLFNCFQVLALESGRIEIVQVVQNGQLMSVGEQTLDHMGADEPRATRY